MQAGYEAVDGCKWALDSMLRMSETALAPTGELRDIHASDRLGPYLRRLWNRRQYIWYVSASELRARQITTVLGNLWHLLNPALSITVYFVIFGLLLNTTRGVDNFMLFLTVGLFVFQFTNRVTQAGASSVVGNTGLLKSIRFPRALLPVTSTLTETLASIPTFVIIYAMALLTQEQIRWTWALLPVVLFCQLFLNLGAAFIAARVTTHFRDTVQILPFVFRLLLYVSGVLFNASAYVSPDLKWLFFFNPMYCYIELARWTMLGGTLAETLVFSATIWTVTLLVAGFLWFRAAEEWYGRD